MKLSRDGLNFDLFRKENDKELVEVKVASDNWFKDTGNLIQRLQAQIKSQTTQQLLAQENTETLMAEGRNPASSVGESGAGACQMEGIIQLIGG